MTMRTYRAFGLRLPLICAMLLVVAACARTPVSEDPTTVGSRTAGLDVARLNMAVDQAKAMRAQGQRVWCVPFARNASGVDIRGNAETWYASATEFGYSRGQSPMVGSVMVFAGGSGLTAGHVAMVSRIVGDREILVDHANWKRNEVSLGMRIIDVSDAGNWSSVQVESTPGAFGRTYRIDGFVYPNSTAL